MKKSDQKLALITGASAGIGLELAKLHASKGGNLVLVARRKDRLEGIKSQLEEEFGIHVHVIATDLSITDGAEHVFLEVSKMNLCIDYLINNAGFSKQGYFHESEWPEEESMIMVNVMAMVRLTHLFLPEMVKQKRGKILFVASSAAYAPGGPLQSIYYATKAFIVSFSRGLAGELADSDVTTTVLCPGATETEFEKVSGLDQTSLFSKEKVFTASEVAKDGYDAMMRGDMIKMTALTAGNKFVLRNMNLLPTKKVLEQIKKRQEVIKV